MELSREALEQLAAASRLAGDAGAGAEAAAAQLDSKYGTLGAGASGFSLAALHKFGSLEAMFEEVKTWPGADREGVVLRFCFPDGASHRVKIKGEEYLIKHRAKDGFSKKKVWEEIKKEPTAALDAVAAMRAALPEELLEEFDTIVGRVDMACDVALADVAAQYALAVGSMPAEVREEQRWLTKKQLAAWMGKEAAWSDGTAFSPTFESLRFAPFVPFEGGKGAQADVPTEPGAWKGLRGKGRKALLTHVLRTLEAEDRAQKAAETRAQGAECGQ